MKRSSSIPVSYVGFSLLVLASLARQYIYMKGGRRALDFLEPSYSELPYFFAVCVMVMAPTGGFLCLIGALEDPRPWPSLTRSERMHRGLGWLGCIVFVVHLIPHLRLLFHAVLYGRWD